MVVSRRQHTIPQFYLRRFLEPGFVYRRGADAPRAIRTPKDVAVHEDYYGKGHSAWVSLDDINSMAEDIGAPAMTLLIDDFTTFTADDWHALSLFMANLAVRTPAFINEVKDTLLAAFSQITELLEPQIAALPPGTNFDSSALDKLNEAGNRLQSPGGHIEAAPFHALADIAHCIRQMEFFLLDAPPECQFVTSDRPLVLRRFPTGSRVGVGWANPDVIGSIALCPNRSLLMLYRDERCINLADLSPEQVANWNVETIGCADKEVYSAVENQEAHDWMKGIGRWCP